MGSALLKSIFWLPKKLKQPNKWSLCFSTKFFFSIKYRYNDVLLKNINLIYNRLFCCNHTGYNVGMVSVTSASRYVTSASRYHSRSSMYIRGLIPWNPAKSVETVPIDKPMSLRGRPTEQQGMYKEMKKINKVTSLLCVLETVIQYTASGGGGTTLIDIAKISKLIRK